LQNIWARPKRDANGYPRVYALGYPWLSPSAARTRIMLLNTEKSVNNISF
jgi:hypothetical protein